MHTHDPMIKAWKMAATVVIMSVGSSPICIRKRRTIARRTCILSARSESESLSLAEEYRMGRTGRR